MKRVAVIIIILFIGTAGSTQALPDSLRYTLEAATDDSTKFQKSRAIYTFYEETNRDSALKYAIFRHALAKKNKRQLEEAYTQGQIAYQQIYLGLFSEALHNLIEAFSIAKSAKEADTWELMAYNTPRKNRQILLSMLNHMYGHLKLQTGSPESLYYFEEGRRIGKAIGNDFRVTVADMVLASNHLLLHQPDTSLLFAKEGETYGIHGGIEKYLAYIYSVMGDIYREKHADSVALIYYHKSLKYAINEANFTVLANVYQNLFNYYADRKQADSMFYYAFKNLSVVKSLGAVTSFATSNINLGRSYENLAAAYSLQGDTDSANSYLQLTLTVKDSLNNIRIKRLAAFQRSVLDQQVRSQEEEKKRVDSETRRRMYLLAGAILAAVVIILLIYRNNRQKTKAFKLLTIQKAETDAQKDKADAALLELKTTQAQLIQSEKMASLGELTAGIAHEIQNPLNFVNNFSEVSNEMMDEMNAELEKGDIEEAKAISADIKQNLEKIHHHGKRADAIVKGMLLHSRKTEGEKEPTNINALTDEYLRLAYHGLRAKDNSFNAVLHTDYDEGIGNVTIIPQDIGRVILNLITNAFYAVAEKEKQSPGSYHPTVWVSTKKLVDKVEIKVADNGSGIPQNIINKIFQPFFTTKPTGQGTGLGLSLAYDIVKAHGGELRVETKEGEGAVFIMLLPVQIQKIP